MFRDAERDLPKQSVLQPCDMQPSGGSLAGPSQEPEKGEEPEAASEEREAPAKADGLAVGATRTEAPRAERELLAKRRGCSSASRRK